MKSGFVSIIGRPNVGKSTMLNTLINKKVSITSHVPNTTRDQIQGIYNSPNSQIIFIDTPGITKNSNLLGKNMLARSLSSLQNVDLVLLLIDGSKPLQQDDDEIIEKVKDLKTKIILVITKIDLMPKERLIKKLQELGSKTDFFAYIPISSIKNNNLNTLIKEIENNLPEGPQYYHEDDVTNVSNAFMAKEVIREKAIFNLHEELPHSIAVEITKFKNKENKIDITANLIVERESHKPIVIGDNGEKINKITHDTVRDLSKYWDKKVYLQLHVVVKPDWKNSASELHKLQYNN
ncbi:hypothetical protein ASO20_02905 [Mycoplasma sp. (ex Biomphalaria glabrata)]|uniref:GTPase Era n=1 Tax=Mycoplasma sp. (ex Biomphalaria glabrata) TaxID=1749074 RepID=UPI00073AABB9|nr:GTPase Era [Mycoplasma sp. (ex Biomphalaria glabrata)]ALV23583.1 hypothetical protein ASO20_02905 [Mycoplasma sp. (ex Biomphalaria glabrata)]